MLYFFSTAWPCTQHNYGLWQAAYSQFSRSGIFPVTGKLQYWHPRRIFLFANTCVCFPESLCPAVLKWVIIFWGWHKLQAKKQRTITASSTGLPIVNQPFFKHAQFSYQIWIHSMHILPLLVPKNCTPLDFPLSTNQFLSKLNSAIKSESILRTFCHYWFVKGALRWTSQCQMTIF